jgi:hypothetical protein
MGTQEVEVLYFFPLPGVETQDEVVTIEEIFL